jgi:predicted pyridoxine 5'-phosphate oxidase superfamily flavin-nucleotide-binding protein
MSRPTSDVAFTPAVKAAQERLGSRAQYEAMERGRGWQSTITPELAEVLAMARSFYLGTASAAGQPYIQHRGGPPGFLRALGAQTIGFADFLGNRQYITAGNLSENPRAFILLMDYARRRRVKLWGTARIVEDDDDLLASLRPAQGHIKVERSIVFTIEAWDKNCPQHIPQLVAVEDVEEAVLALQKRIAELEGELRSLKA